MTTIEIPFSQLIREPRATMAKLEASPRRRLRLDRRDGGDLILESAERAEAEDEALDMASRLFFSLVKNDDGARLLLLSLAEVFPWAAASVGNLAAVEPVVASWRATAEVYSDPELLDAATGALDGTDFGEVPRDRGQ